MNPSTGQMNLRLSLFIDGLTVAQSYEGRSLAVETTEFTSSGQVLPCLHLDYSVAVDPSPTLLGQEYVNHILTEEGDLLLETLSVLIGEPYRLLLFTATLDGQPVRYEPEASRIISLRNHASDLARLRPRPTSFHAAVTDFTWTTLETVVQEFRARRTDALKARIALPRRWFALGSAEMSSPQRLFAFWLSFNALYADPDTDGEKAQITTFIKKKLPPAVATRYVQNQRQALSNLAAFPITLRRRRGLIQIAADLAAALAVEPSNPMEIVGKSLLTIYGVRSNLFHGEYDITTANHFDQITWAELLLSPLVRQLIAVEMLGHELPPGQYIEHIMTGL